MSEPSQARIRWTRSLGRTKASSGPTTVGPETTRIAPVISAACSGMPSSSNAMHMASARVTGTPSAISRQTTRRVCPVSFRSSSPRPASYRITATASDTSGWKAGPSSLSGLTSLVSAPAAKPTGSKTISAGIRRRLASTWDPTASNTIRPRPMRI